MKDVISNRYYVPMGTPFYDLTKQGFENGVPTSIEIYGRTTENLMFSGADAFLIPEWPSRLGYNWVYKNKVYRITFNRQDVTVLP